ncbi:LysR family transcriptional regulator [Aestuariivirga litoralis]|uniref:LysR family transcriptional regulator n=1 Tax=Aestuariivirga litoralis TaxID=2650924 RepID=UPI0018C84265|nr:LysR family transcriptional regulator [Aestuariivirga litoralis]MBG1230826.1 LysR family transcriptional regulator [Aestuariivirga litoralis]
MEPFAGMETFVAVIETGSITAAAERLQTAKSSVSETIRALEERLGVRLIDRSTRKLQITEAGRLFYERCRKLLEDANAARAEVQAATGSFVGHIRMAVPDSFGARYIVPALKTFLTRYPGIEIELVESHEMIKLVEENIDLAIRIAETPHENLVVRQIGSSQVIIVASPAYLAEHGEPKKPKDLMKHRLIGYSRLRWRDAWLVGGETIAVKPFMLTNSVESLEAAAINGLGLTAVPEWMARNAIAAGWLRRVFPPLPMPTSGIYAVYPTNRLLAPRIREIVDHLAKVFDDSGLGKK